jgi:hypothetical protein
MSNLLAAFFGVLMSLSGLVGLATDPGEKTPYKWWRTPSLIAMVFLGISVTSFFFYRSAQLGKHVQLERDQQMEQINWEGDQRVALEVHLKKPLNLIILDHGTVQTAQSPMGVIRYSRLVYTTDQASNDVQNPDNQQRTAWFVKLPSGNDLIVNDEAWDAWKRKFGI